MYDPIHVLGDVRSNNPSKFKRPPVQDAVSVKPKLNSIQRMVLDMTKIVYTYPSSKPSKTPPNRKPTSPRKASPKTASTVVVDIPKPPAAFRRSDYAPMDDSPKRRKLQDTQVNGNVALAIASKKEKDDLLLSNFENHLLEIFEARDRLAQYTSVSNGQANSAMFDIPDDEGDSEPLLASPVHEKLQATLTRLIASDRLGDVSPGYLQRLQALCEPAIEAAQTINLRVLSDSSDEDITTWLSNLHKAGSGAVAACTLVYTVLGTTQNQDLVNLEVLQWLPNVLVNLFENCLIPVVEARPDGQGGALFAIAAANSEVLKRLLDVGRKLFDLVARICMQVKGAGSLVNSIEFLASKLIFVQNAYTDKSSAIGSQPYERLRKQVMATLSKLYATFPAERGAILDEVLSSLDKLPSNSRSARQYKLGSGKNIQLVSALFMQLVQTPALQSEKNQSRKKHHATRNVSQDSENSDRETSTDNVEREPSAAWNDAEQDSLSKMTRIASNLFDDAFQSARQIVGWMVDKASKVTKSGDSPYRNILDLFVEDLTIVLPSTDWPASELLLTVLAARMISLAKNDKAASIKNMALESLGVMGSAISVTRASARNLLSTVLRDGEQGSTIIQDLSLLFGDAAHFLLQNDELVSPNGPFSIVHSYMLSKGGEGLRTKSAKAYFLVQFATLISRTLQAPRDSDRDGEHDPKLSAMISGILQQLSEPDVSYEVANDHPEVTAQEAQLAYLLSILNMPFCRKFPAIAKTVASSLSSDQAQVRSRSLKSVTTILETDSSLLDWDPTIADEVFKCASDDSSLVRDSALSLIAKFIMPKPSLEEKAFKQLLKCVVDANVGVQKRSMGYLKDIYLRESRHSMKATIAIEFLRRTADHEGSVAELAKKSLAEMWIAPKLTLLATASESAHVEVTIETLTSHIVACINSDTVGLAPLLKDFLAWRLKGFKDFDEVHSLYARIVKKLLDAANGSDAGPADLTTLVAFVEARPQTVVPSDLTSLKSYLKDLSRSDDIIKFKSVVAIFRCVLPHLSSTQAPLLREVQLDLLKAYKTLNRRHELEETMSCLRCIDDVLHEPNRIVSYVVSIMRNILQPQISPQVKQKLTAEGRATEVQVRENRIREQSLRLVGPLAKHINLENYKKTFQAEFPSFRAGSVAGFMADNIVSFTMKDSAIEIRLKALESLGLICQAWPGQFNKKHVRETFFQVLEGSSFSSLGEDDILKMQVMALGIFEELYAKRASVKERASKSDGGAELQALKIIGGDSKTREDDSAISVITNPLVDHLLRIALSETGEKALLAAQTLASIDHQGMTHPKQSTSAFVALETSTDERIFNVARKAHEHLHQQHESVCEREYIHAVFEAFRYQNEVGEDPRGAVVPGFKAKLAPAFAIISSSGPKYVKKFVSNLISKLNTEYSKVKLAEDGVPQHLLLVLFVTQNLALFEYKKLEVLLHTIMQLELAFGKNGTETAQAIELGLPQALPGEAHHEDTADLAPSVPEQPVDPILLKKLTTAACAMTLISEARNHLRRQYGISHDVKFAMQQNKQTKESTKEPVKVHGISGERYWNNSNSVLDSLSTTEAMIQRCREFVTLVAVDDEVKIAEVDGEMHAVTMADQSMPAPRGKKRKSVNGSLGGTPKKPRARPSKNADRRRSSSASSLDDPDGDFAG